MERTLMPLSSQSNLQHLLKVREVARIETLK